MAKTKTPSAPQTIGLTLAVAIGVASMLGAGVFVVFHEAAALTLGVFDRWGLLIAIALAGTVATLNAASVYQLARQVTRAGGVYSYSRVYVGDTSSFIAGFSFVFGKIGSIAAIGLVFGIYVWPDQPVLAAVIAIAGLTVINLLGINRTARVALVLSITTVTFLLTTIVWGFAHGVDVVPTIGVASGVTSGTAAVSIGGGLAVSSILSAAALLFFAFAGYARVATLGDEVRNPQRNIPRAIAIALVSVVLIYVALAIMLQNTLGRVLAVSPAPFITFWQNSTVASGINPAVVSVVVNVVAAAASLGSMLALLAGVSRTAATMAEDRELPRWFSTRNHNGAPWVAEVIVAAGAIALTQLGRLDWVIGFSSLSVLAYYLIGHLAVLRQPASERVMGRWVAWLGALLCAVLLLAVPGPAVAASAAVLVGALLVRRMFRQG